MQCVAHKMDWVLGIDCAVGLGPSEEAKTCLRPLAVSVAWDNWRLDLHNFAFQKLCENSVCRKGVLNIKSIRLFWPRN